MKKNSLLSKPYYLSCSVISFFLILCMLLPSASVYAAEQDEKTPSGLSVKDVQSTIENFYLEHESTAAGMSTAVFDKNGIIYSNCFGYANKEKKIALDKTHVIEWGSVTKTLIWVSAMQLKEQGKLDLDKDIREYLPENFLHNLHFDEPVTMLNLMNHNAGFENMMLGVETPYPEEVVSLGEFLKMHQPQQVFRPGTVSSYNNWSAALAGYIVECISGEPFYDYVRENIFEPLGMKNSSLKPDLSDNPYVAQKRKELECYYNDGTYAGNTYRYINIYPAGMCTSTPDDFIAYARAIADPDSPLFQQKETYQEMISPSAYLGNTDFPTNCHGFWTLEFGDNVIGHSGATSGCTSQLQFDTKTGIGMIVLTNQCGEYNFANKMVQLIMGKPSADVHDGIDGIVMSPATNFTGPLKILSYFNIVPVTKEELKNTICTYQKTDYVEKLALPSADYLVLSDSDYSEINITIIFCFIAVIFGFIALWTKLIRLIARQIRKKENDIPLGKWSAASCLLMITPVLLLIPFFLSMASETQWSFLEYEIWSACYFAIAAALVILSIAGIVLMIKNQMTIKRRIFNIAVIICMASIIYNIIYWQLYMFWMI